MQSPCFLYGFRILFNDVCCFQVIQSSAETKKGESAEAICLVEINLKLEDNMSRKLTTDIFQGDTPENLAKDLVTNGFIHSVRKNKQEIDQRGTVRDVWGNEFSCKAYVSNICDDALNICCCNCWAICSIYTLIFVFTVLTPFFFYVAG